MGDPAADGVGPDRPAWESSPEVVRAEIEALRAELNRSRRTHERLRATHAETVNALAATVRTLEHRARTDQLTGLLNRRGFFDALDARLDGEWGTGHGSGAALFIDLDRFKSINDLHGHAIGDCLLVTVAERLKATSGIEVAARLAGDEFVALVRGKVSTATGIAQQFLDALGTPIRTSAATFELTASIGVAELHRPATADEVVTNADLAMMRAKLHGRGRISCFDQGLRKDMAFRSARESHLSVALANDQLVVRYQPIVELESLAVVGVEALVRWRHPEEGLLGPDAFLPLAEELGVIGRLDDMVLRKALHDMSWLRDEVPAAQGLRMSINVSPVSLSDASLPERTLTSLTEAGYPADLLEVELTETGVLDGRIGTRSVQRLHDLGVHICIDDFGTGWSSLCRLRTLPVGRLKLDRDFVSGVCHERADRAIVRGMVELAEALGLELVAEGVESAEQLRLLRRLGCQIGQGYLFGAPLAVDQLADHLRRTVEPWMALVGGAGGVTGVSGMSGMSG